MVQPRITLCSVCHSQMPPGQQFCNNCGATLCPHCHEPLPKRSRYCPKCGFLCATEQRSSATKSPPTTSAQPQAAARPTAQTPPPQPVPQTAMRQQPPVAPTIGHENNCPKCGAIIDPELGRCTGCGLLYGGKHRTMQRAAPATPAARPLLTPKPQSPAAQQPPAAYGSGQHPSYSPPGAMPQVGIPIPRAVPVAASTARMPVNPPMPASPYPQQALPPTSVEGGISATKKRGFPGFITALFIIIVLALIGGGIYYFINQAETPPPSNGITDITPLSIQNVSSSSVTKTGAIITWDTNEPTTGKVEYGTSEAYGSTALDTNTTLSNSHSITLTSLDPGTKYYFKVISEDAAGNAATAKGNLTTVAEADETPPTISGVSFSNITESSAIIAWKTNEPATSQVQYGKTETYGSETTENTDLSTNHSVTLNGLSGNTTYYFKVISKDASGNEATLAAENQKFTTEAVIPVGYEKGNRAPEFTLKDLNDHEVKLSDFRGEIVIVNFWFTTCVPCAEEFPYLQAVSDNWTGEDLKILAVNYKDTQSRVLEWINNQEKEYTFTVLFDPNGAVNTLYNVNLWPTTFFIDAEGIIREIQEGSFGSQTEIEDILDTL